jgi:hypothetical protein
MEAGLVFAFVLGLAALAMWRGPEGVDSAQRSLASRTTDQHFGGCDDARAAGRENIPAWDPSYRESMDGDGDGLACEPYRRF